MTTGLTPERAPGSPYYQALPGTSEGLLPCSESCSPGCHPVNVSSALQSIAADKPCFFGHSIPCHHLEGCSALSHKRNFLPSLPKRLRLATPVLPRRPEAFRHYAHTSQLHKNKCSGPLKTHTYSVHSLPMLQQRLSSVFYDRERAMHIC